MPAWFYVVPDGRQWVVRSQAEEYGRFPSQMEAFGRAVLEARKVKAQGRSAQVSVLRDEDEAKMALKTMLLDVL